MFMKPPAAPKTKVPKPGTRATTPGTQPKIGKTGPIATMSKAPPPTPFAGARRMARAPANQTGKHAIPRAAVETRAKPRTEY
jgi:hypothetical protein